MVLTDTRFRLSPAGLVRVRQSLKTLEPVDELRKGPFTLQVRVLEYRHVDTGVEVDISLTATSHTGRPVWESILTLLSKHRLHQDSRYFPKTGNDNNHESGQPDEPLPEAVKQVAVSVPLSPTLQSLWSCSDCFPHRLLSLTPRLFGCGSHVIPGLWTLSVCLAEIEKHKGVEVIAAPVSVTARFEEPLLVTGKVMIKFWEMDKGRDQSSSRGVEFLMERDGGRNAVVGRVLKSSL
ncbi:uncharacterized protein si:ch211-12e13.1 isoform X2 [Betta splendens]|nr:uncharacterized protein si:ch211-12e13.1 isoform X2 [Betta splendens]